MPVVLFIRVERRLGGRQGKDQPAMAGVDRGELENVAKEFAVGFRVFAVDDDVSAGNHGGYLLLFNELLSH